MKTSTKVILTIGVILVAVGATILNISLGRGERPDRFGISITAGKPSNQKDYTVCMSGEEEFDPSEIKSLDIDWISDSVTIKEYDGSKLVIKEDINGSATEYERMRWRVSGGELDIIACANNIGNLPKKDLTVLVPSTMKLRTINVNVASAKVDLIDLAVDNSIDVDSASGDLYVEGVKCKNLLLDSASGDQTVKDCNVEAELNANMASGSFSAESVNCKIFDVDGVSGTVEAEDLVCETASVDTASGKVTLAFAKACGKVDVDTVSGAVKLIFPKGTGVEIDFDSVSGKVRGDVKYGDLPVNVDTTSGDLMIEYR